MDDSGKGRPPSLLLVEDEDDLRWLLARVFEKAGYRVAEASSAEEALEAWREESRDAVVTDLKMPGASGLDLMRELHAEEPRLPVIFISAMEDVATAVQAIKDGAWDYLTKPFDNEHLLAVVARALDHLSMRREIQDLRKRVRKRPPFFGNSAPARRLEGQVRLLASHPDLTVLIEGESGTGKEVFARALHEASPRSGAPFLAFDCGALPENLSESMLFGHCKGAFTGADRDHRGLFEQAAGGTVLLDECGNLSPALQGKLLRCLQEREVLPLGASRPRSFDARILAATNDDLEARMEEGSFRLDLFHRLAEFRVRLPALKERPADVPIFARHFLAEAAAEQGRRPPFLPAEAEEHLSGLPWPGNLRELRNEMRRLCLLRPEAEIDLPSLLEILGPGSPGGTNPSRSPGDPVLESLPLKERIQRTVERLEQDWILEAIEACGGNKAAAARRLGIDYTTLHRKLRRLRAR